MSSPNEREKDAESLFYLRKILQTKCDMTAEERRIASGVLLRFAVRLKIFELTAPSTTKRGREGGGEQGETS